jgi:hypothetical protein
MSTPRHSSSKSTRKRKIKDASPRSSTPKKQKTILSPLHSWTYIIAHGCYKKKEETFTLPYNIRLIQYTEPRSVLCFTDAYFIIRQLSTIKNNKPQLNNLPYDTKLKVPPILVEKHGTGKSYLPNFGRLNYYRAVEPGTVITNMLIEHGNHSEYTPYYRLHYIDADGKVNYLDTPSKDTDLKTVLTNMSNAYKEACYARKLDCKKPLNVVQLTCQEGEFYTVEELSTYMSQLRVDEPRHTCNETYSLLANLYLKKRELKPSKYFAWLDKHFNKVFLDPYHTFEELNIIQQVYCEKIPGLSSASTRRTKKMRSPFPILPESSSPMEVVESVSSPNKKGTPMDIVESVSSPKWNGTPMDIDYLENERK